MIAFETAYFLKTSDRLKNDLSSLSLSNLQGMRSYLSTTVDLNNRYTSSFVYRYLDPKTEIRVTFSLHHFHIFRHVLPNACHILHPNISMSTKHSSLHSFPTIISLSQIPSPRSILLNLSNISQRRVFKILQTRYIYTLKHSTKYNQNWVLIYLLR